MTADAIMVFFMLGISSDGESGIGA
jgi:hypothetical protein